MSGYAVRAPRLAVLISGRGSNLAAIVRAIDAARLNAEICAVISNRPAAAGLTLARARGLPAEVVDHRHFADREAFEARLTECIDAQRPDLVVLAGFMRVLTAGFVQRFPGRLLNIHPSLLPRYPGLRTHQRALAAGDAEHGATVHVVSDALDGGPAIAQITVSVQAGDSPERLAARVLQQEHHLLPTVLQWFAAGRLDLSATPPRLDGQPLTQPYALPPCAH